MCSGADRAHYRCNLAWMPASKTPHSDGLRGLTDDPVAVKPVARGCQVPEETLNSGRDATR